VVNRNLERHAGGLSQELKEELGTARDLTMLSQGIMPLADVEKRAILSAIEFTKGDRTLAATMLGIGRTTLYRKLKEYGL
jgi:transcriptional regulator of acetoin/glycerol metabolism